MIKVSDFIAKHLKQVYKVETIFMVSGGGAMHLNDSFGKTFRYICNHNEQASAIAAEGFARANQDLAVVNVTTGPGGLNCLNGVFGEWTDSVPVLYISGQVKYSTTIGSCPDLNLRQLGDQEVDIINVVKPLTKYAKMVVEPKRIKYELDKAIYESTNGRKGPVWLDIPMNVQSSMIDENELEEFITPAKTTFDLKIDDVIEKLKTAKRPLIIAGHGIKLSKTKNEFKNLLEKLNIPVVTTFNGLDILTSEDKNFVGRIGTIGQRNGNFALQNADMILCLGTRNNIRQVSYNFENFAKNAFKIVVDIDESELKKPLVKPDLAIHADLKEFLPELVKKIEKLERYEWLNFCQNLKEKYSFENVKEYESKLQNSINPYCFTRKLTEMLNGDEIIVSTNATASISLFQVGVIKENTRVISNSGDASMGYGIAAAIGASLKAENVICLEGDGSIMMNLQELQTIKHNNLPIKIFIINNNGYSSIKQSQSNFFDGKLTGCDCISGVSCPDFVKIAKAFKIKAFRIDNYDKMQEQIKQVLDLKELVVCEVIVEKDYIFAPKLSSKTLEDGTMVSASLEDMYPFLSESEMKENMPDWN